MPRVVSGLGGRSAAGGGWGAGSSSGLRDRVLTYRRRWQGTGPGVPSRRESRGEDRSQGAHRRRGPDLGESDLSAGLSTYLRAPVTYPRRELVL